MCNEQTCANKTGLNHPFARCSFPMDRSKAVLLLQFVFVCAWFHMLPLYSYLFLISRSLVPREDWVS